MFYNIFYYFNMIFSKKKKFLNKDYCRTYGNKMYTIITRYKNIMNGWRCEKITQYFSVRYIFEHAKGKNYENRITIPGEMISDKFDVFTSFEKYIFII